MIKSITLIFFIALCLLSPSSCKQDTKQEPTFTFEFMTLGVPEVRNTLDTNQMGAKFYLRTTQGSDSILIKINVVNDDWLFEENDSIYNSKIKSDYFYAAKDKTLDSFIIAIKNSYSDRPNGSLIENIPDTFALYCGSNYYFSIRDNLGYEKYYNYKATRLQDPLKKFHYFIEEKYYHKKFQGNVARVKLNTDSLAIAYFTRPGIIQVVPPPNFINPTPIRFLPPKISLK